MAISEHPPANDEAQGQAFLNLSNHFLIAMPNMADDWFAKSVVFICEHSPFGAMGLVINKPSDLTLGALFEKIDLPLPKPFLAEQWVMQGGPVSSERGFILHDRMSAIDASAQAGIDGPSDFGKLPVYTSTIFVNDTLEVTASKDILEAVAEGAGPKRLLMALGYASWGAGQLESEISENVWLTAQADERLIFESPIGRRYADALALLGISEVDLSAVAGHA